MQLTLDYILLRNKNPGNLLDQGTGNHNGEYAKSVWLENAVVHA